jgi:hemerythrin-like domain-containing protein
VSLPVDILVNEHKLILQAVDLLRKENEKIQTSKTVNANFITKATDFFRTFADRFHHGKEEGILFRDLSQKKVNKSDHLIMTELMQEHAFARRTVKALEDAKEKYIAGNTESLNEVLDLLATLIKLYPAHIEKEDKHFFYPCMEYFSGLERQNMLTSFLEFNQNFTEKRYKQVIDSLR